MIRDLAKSEFDWFFAIMEASFPDDERRAYEEQRALLTVPEYKIHVWEEHDELCGFAAVWGFPGFTFLEHLAVAPEHRNGGIGGRLLRGLLEGRKKPICLEVEPPETELCRRRIGFYERNGFCLNEYPYRQPPISRGKQPVPLMIMTSGSCISKAEFEEIKHTLYARVYGCE